MSGVIRATRSRIYARARAFPTRTRYGLALAQGNHDVPLVLKNLTITVGLVLRLIDERGFLAGGAAEEALAAAEPGAGENPTKCPPS